MGMDPNTVMLHHQSIVSPRFGQRAITLLEVAKPISYLMILVVYKSLMLGFLTHSSGKWQTFSRGGKPNKGKGPTGALVGGSRGADCFNRSLRSSCKRHPEAVASKDHFRWSFRVNCPFGVLSGATRGEPRWRTPWGRWWQIVGVGNRGKNTYARFPVFPRLVPTGHVVSTSQSSNKCNPRVPANMRGRWEIIHTTNNATRVTTGVTGR